MDLYAIAKEWIASWDPETLKLMKRCFKRYFPLDREAMTRVMEENSAPLPGIIRQASDSEFYAFRKIVSEMLDKIEIPVAA